MQVVISEIWFVMFVSVDFSINDLVLKTIGVV